MRILNTRPAHQAARLNQLLATQKMPVRNLPLLNIKPVLLAQKEYVSDTAIFLSANAVLHFYAQAIVKAKTLVAIGPATAQALATKGVAAVTCPAHFSSEGLLMLPCLQTVENQSILLVSGVAPKPLLAAELTHRGARVKNVACYERIPVRYDSVVVLSVLKEVTHIVVTSGESLRALLHWGDVFSDQLQSKTLCVINDEMKKQASMLGFTNIIVADNATDDAIFKALTDQG